MSLQAESQTIRVTDGVLICPRCGDGGGLHHDRVAVYQRREDQSQVLRTIVDGANGGTRNDIVSNDDGNPSCRRHGLAIDFHCEHCGNVGELTIAQHKGQTLINWR